MYATPTAEISLNTPAKCLSSVPGDTRHHRFLVGTCALPSVSSNQHHHQQQQQQQQSNDMDRYHDPSLHGLYGNDIGSHRSIHPQMPPVSSSTNHVYLLRYHEEMNELAVDAQFELPYYHSPYQCDDMDGEDVGRIKRSSRSGNDTNESSYGEIWCLSSCPIDTTLLVTNTSTLHNHHHNNNTNPNTTLSNAAETLLWRMPDGSLNDEDIDYYHPTHHPHDDDNDDDPPMSNTHQRHTHHHTDIPLPLQPVARLVYPHHDTSHTNTIGDGDCPAVLRGRVSDMHWNPECLPDVVDDSFYTNHSHSRSYEDDPEEGDDDDDRRSESSFSPPKNRASGLGGTRGLGLGGLGGGGGGPNFLTVEYGTSTVTTWDLQTSDALPVHHIRIPSSTNDSSSLSYTPYYSSLYTPPKASWDPHNTNRVAVTTGRHVAFLDVRCSHTTTGEGGGGGGEGRGFIGGLQNCHRFGVLDVDYNPNVPHTLTTCGQDGLVKFWDVRKGSSNSALLRSTTTDTSFTRYGMGVSAVGRGHTPSPTRSVSPSHSNRYTTTMGVEGEGGGNESIVGWMTQNPLRTVRGGHTHWTTAVKYNAFHDQLLLSAGTDGAVNLWRISSVSSAPMAMDCGGGGGRRLRNRRGSRGGRGDDGNSNADNDVEDDDDLARFLTYRDKDPADNDDDYDDDDDDDHANGPSTAGPLSDDDDDEDDDEDGGDRPDVRVTRTELSEAVYDVAWSAADPWVFAGLGYDGSVVLNHVPSKEKYKILL